MKHEHFLIAGVIVSLVFVGSSALFAEEEEDSCSQHSYDKGGPPKGVIEEFDKDGDGKLSDEEKEAFREAHKQKMLKEFDTNGDGELSQEEHRTMRQKMMQKRWGEKKRHHGEGERKEKSEDEDEDILPKPPTEE